MADQVQCPNCGGYKVIGKGQYVSRSTGSKVGNGDFAVGMVMLWLLFGWVPVVIVVYSMQALLAHNGAAMFLVGLAVYAGAAASLVGMYKRTMRGRRLDGHNNECQLCGYKWYGKAGVLPTSVTPNPALIALGEHKLRDDAAAADAARRREEA